MTPVKSQPIGAMAPNAVATPFPPLKPKKTGQICPRQAAIAISPSQKGVTPNAYAPQTGNMPLRMSKISTATAAPLPPIRNTFVAPGLPEPLSRGSGSPAMRQTRMALEIEPQRYAKRIIPGAIALISCSVLKVSFYLLFLWIIRTFRRKWYPG